MNERDVDVETEARIARTKERASAALDARVARGFELASGFAEAADVIGEIERSGRARRSWRRVAAIAAGILLLSSGAYFVLDGKFGWFRRAPSQAEETSTSPSVTSRSRPPQRSSGSSTSQEPDAPTGQAHTEVHDEEDPRRSGNAPLTAPEGTEKWARTVLKLAAQAQRDALQSPTGGRKLGGPTTTMDAPATVANAPVIARLRTETAGDETGRFPVLEVVSVYREQKAGMAPAIGARIELLPGGDPGQRSFLDWCGECSDAPFTSGTTFIACLRPFPLEVRDAPLSRFSIAFGDLYSCTLVSHDLPRVAPSDDVSRVMSALRRDLVASLADASAKVRLGAVTALRHYETLKDQTPALPDPGFATWMDPESERALLLLGDDADARIRWHVAWMGPAAMSQEGLALARRLAFDPEPLVRRPAERWLEQWGTADDHVCEVELSRFRDETYERFIGFLAPDREPPESADALMHAIARLLDPGTSDRSRVQIAWSLDDVLRSRPLLNALVAALDDPEMDVRRGAARSLGGRAVSEDAIGPLLAISAGEDPRVRAMAQLSRCRLGDPRALVDLSSLLSGAHRGPSTDAQIPIDVLACLQTIALLAEPDDRPPVTDRSRLLIDALSHPVPIVRARALVALARLGGRVDVEDQAAIEQAITSAAQESAVLVRMAAEVSMWIFDREVAADAAILRAIGYTDK